MSCFSGRRKIRSLGRRTEILIWISQACSILLPTGRAFHEKPPSCQAPPPKKHGGYTRGRSPLVGGAALFAAWGEPSHPGFPRRGNGKGVIRFPAAAGAFP